MKRALLALCFVTVLGGPVRADAEAPYAAMRTLQVLQEQVAHGNATAQTAQPQLMAHIAEGFAAANPDAWREPRNARAAILFLMSGGRPQVIRAILAQASFPRDLDRLLKGALAYGEGEDEVARTLLDGVDPQSLPTDLGAHLALVRGNLAAEQDAAKAIRLLDTARLLAPGTLIEEAALRREVFLLIGKGEIDKAMLLSRQYLRRFRKSSYATNFQQRFVSAAIGMAVAGDTAQLSQLDSVLSELSAAENLNFYLTLARTALLEGKMPGARTAARKAAALAGKGSSDETRAKLYLAASEVVAEDPSPGLFALAGLEPSHLDAPDVALREAALAIGSAIRAEGAQAALAADQAGKPDDTIQATMDHARAALDEGARLAAASRP